MISSPNNLDNNNTQQQQQQDNLSSPSSPSSLPLKVRALILLNRFRRFCNNLIHERWYNYTSLAVITFNSIILTQHRYEDIDQNLPVAVVGASDSTTITTTTEIQNANLFNQFLAMLNHICIFIFLCELIIKFAAVGLEPFFRNPWDVMDFCVIIFSTFAIFLESISNVSSLRVLRWLMPMYSDQGAPAPLRVVTETVFASLQGILDVMMLSAGIIGLFTVAGIQVWGGYSDNRCYITNITCQEGFDFLNQVNNAQKYPIKLFSIKENNNTNNNSSSIFAFPLLMTGLAQISGCGETLKCPTSREINKYLPTDDCIVTECLADQSRYTLPYRNCNSFADCYMVMFNTFLTNDWSIDWEWLLQAKNNREDFYIILIFAYVLAYIGNYVGQSLYLCVVANVYSYVAPDCFLKSTQQIDDEDISASTDNPMANTKTTIAWVNPKMKTPEKQQQQQQQQQDHHEEVEEEELPPLLEGDALLGVPSNIDDASGELETWCQLRLLTRKEIQDFNKRQVELLNDKSANAWFSRVQAQLRLGHDDKRHISRCIVGFVVSHPVWGLICLLAAFACTAVLILDNPNNSFVDPHDSFGIVFFVGSAIFLVNLLAHVFAFGLRHCFLENRELRKNLTIDLGILIRSVLVLIFPPSSTSSSTSNNNQSPMHIAASSFIQSVESTLRLCFIVKLIFLVPPLRRMFHIAFRSIRSIAYLSALSVLVIFVFSIVGYHAFGDLTNFGGRDYPLKFDTWLQSFYLSFIVATGDIVIPYMRYLMQDLPAHTRWIGVVWVMSIYYSLRGLVVNITACIAVQDVYTATVQQQQAQQEADKKENNNNIEAQGLVTNSEFVTMITEWWQNFMDLITGHITEGPPPLILPPAPPPKPPVEFFKNLQTTETTTTTLHKPEFVRNGKIFLTYLSPLFELKQVTLTWSETFDYWYHHPPMFDIHRVFVPPLEKSLSIFLPNSEIRKFALKIVFHPLFRWSCSIMVVINFVSFLVWPLRVEILEKYGTESKYTIYYFLELLINIFFTVECLIQIISFGFAFPSASKWNLENQVTIKNNNAENNNNDNDVCIAGYKCANYEVETDEGQFDEETPLRLSYLSDLYNVFDFLGAIGALATLTTVLHPAFRLLRALRVARLLTLLPESESTFVAFCRALPVAATKILPLGLVIFTFIGIWGVELFQGKMGVCNDRTIKTRAACVGYFNEPNLYAATTTPAGMIFGPALVDPFSMDAPTTNFSLLSSSSSTSQKQLFFSGRPRKWQIASYNYENLSEAFMNIFIISGWASTSDLLFNAWNAAPHVDEAMSPGASPLGPIYIMCVYFVACVFTANCMCGFLMYYLLEYRKQYDVTLQWLPEQKLALRQRGALRSLLHESDVKVRFPDPSSSFSKLFHNAMRWAPDWFLERSKRWFLDPSEKSFEKVVKKMDKEEKKIEEQTEQLLEKAESFTADFTETASGTFVPPPPLLSSVVEKEFPQPLHHKSDNNNNSASASSPLSLSSAVRMMGMFKNELFQSIETSRKISEKQQQQQQTATTTTTKLSWSATELARIEPLSVFDSVVYLVIAINFIANALHSPASTSPEVIFILDKIIQSTLLLFTIELTMRFVAYKHHILFSKGGLWYHVASREWTFDAFVTICGWLASPALNLVPYCGLFSFLRVLKFKKLIGPRIGVIRLLEATENAHRQIWGSLLIVGFGFFLFAVAGVEFFHGTIVPPLMVGWNTEYRHMNATLPALKLLFDANSGDNWIDFPSDYIAGFRNTLDYNNNDGSSSSSTASSTSSTCSQQTFETGFRGNHKYTDVDVVVVEENANINNNKNEQQQICRNSKSLVRWYFTLSDLILSIVGPAFVGAVMYDALVMGQDEIEDKCRISLLRFHRAWNQQQPTVSTMNLTEEQKQQKTLPVGEFLRRVLTRLPRDLTKFSNSNNNNNNNEDQKKKNENKLFGMMNNENEDISSAFASSPLEAAASVLPKPGELLSYLLKTPIPLREGNLVSFDGCLSAIIISGYKLSGPKAERVLGAKAFGQLAKLLGNCRVYTVAHYVAVRIIWYYWGMNREKILSLKKKKKKDEIIFQN